MPEERTPERSAGEAEHGGSTVDVERLADRVYRLMLADVRLERARSGDTDQLRKST
jgi:hypothetical protein